MYEWIAFLENALNNNFTFSVIFVLGMFHALESESFPFLNAIGPLLIILLGIDLLSRSVKEVRHEHDDECDEPMHFHFNQSKFSSPFITGTVAGLIPCPSAIAVLLIASTKFSNNTFILYSSILTYVLGIALTLIGIMVLFLLFKDQFSKQLNSIKRKPHTQSK